MPAVEEPELHIQPSQQKRLYGRLHLDSDDAGSSRYAVRREWRVGGGIQLNPHGFLGGSIDRELASLYGPTRIVAAASAAIRDASFCRRLSGDARLQWILDSPPGMPALITQVEGTCLPRRWGGAGVFVRLHDGQDYYNLAFTQRITRLQFGVTLQRDQFLGFFIAPQ